MPYLISSCLFCLFLLINLTISSHAQGLQASSANTNNLYATDDLDEKGLDVLSGNSLNDVSSPDIHTPRYQLEGQLDEPLSEILSASLEKPVPKVQYNNWKESYLRLIKHYEDIGDTQAADDIYYHYRLKRPILKIKHIEAGPDKGKEYIIGHGWWEKTREWAEYILVGLTCGYGVRPLRPIAVWAALISCFTLIYFSDKNSLEYQIEKKGRKTHISEMPGYLRLYNCFYFSGITFTTIGYGDIQPRGWFKIIAIIEGIVGGLTMALFLVILGHVWMR